MIVRSPNIVAVTLLCGLVATTAFAQSADPLPSWNDGPTKQSIMAFVGNVTREGSPDFVPAAERIATFDNDAIHAFAMRSNSPGVMFDEPAATSVSSDGDFMRAFAERVYGVPPEQVVGSEGKLKLEMRDGTPVLVKLPALDFVDDKENKPIAIQGHIGRRPIAAFGNSDGDLAMLQWTCAGTGARLCLFVRHTDAEREWAYDVSPLGRLEKGLVDASAKGWTVVDMKADWKVIYPFQKK